MKKFFSSLLMLLLLTMFSCTALADTGKIGTVKVVDYICIENTDIKYEVTKRYNRSHLFEEYIYPGTTLYIEASEALSTHSVSLVPAQRQTYSGNGGCLTFAFYYMMDEATYEQLKYEDQNNYGGGGATGNPSGIYYNGYNIVITDENGKALDGYTASMDILGWDGKYISNSKTTDSEGKTTIDAMLNSMLGFSENRGYLPSGGDETDEYGNRIGVFTESIHTDPAHPLIIKDASGKQIVKISPKDYSATSYLAPKQSEEIVIDNSFFDITADANYSVSITSPDFVNDQYAMDYPMLTVNIQKQKDNTDIVIKKGDKFTSGNLNYKVTAFTAKNKTVSVTGASMKTINTVTIPATVTFRGENFKVTSIDKNAFKGYSKLTKVTIGKNVTSIGASAFYNCKKLSSVTISTGMKVINTKAFMKCKNLKKITIKSKVLTTVGKNALKGIPKNCVIKVPSSKLNAYKKLLSGKGQPKSVKITK